MTLLLREYLIQQFFCKICCFVCKSFVLLQTKKEFNQSQTFKPIANEINRKTLTDLSDEASLTRSQSINKQIY